VLTFDEALWALLLARVRHVVRDLLKRLQEVVGEMLPLNYTRSNTSVTTPT
jgi:hypothetical protein